MRQDIKEQWVNALRSGAFRQGRRYLAKDGGYCCLGVLCELAYREGVLTERVDIGDDGESAVMYDGHLSVLPDSVIDWADLDDCNPQVDHGDRLSNMNDRGVSFRVIAGLIEGHL